MVNISRTKMQSMPFLGTTTGGDPLINQAAAVQGRSGRSQHGRHSAPSGSPAVSRELKLEQLEGKSVVIQDGRRTRQRDGPDRTS